MLVQVTNPVEESPIPQTLSSLLASSPSYRGLTLVLTFLSYTSYHLSRKPISIVKVSSSLAPAVGQGTWRGHMRRGVLTAL